MSIFKNKVSFHNRFDIIVKDVSTGEIKQEAEALNIVTDYGISEILHFDDYWFNRIAVGRGTGEPLSDDNSLFSQIGYKSSLEVEATKAIPTSSWTRMIEIGTTEMNGETITEVGVGYDNYMFSKALIKDESGNPISIVKTDLDIVEVYATVYLTVDTDTPGLYWHDPATNYLIDLFTEYATSVADSLEDVDTLEARYDGTLIGSIDGNYAYSFPDKKITFTGRFDVNDANGTINELGVKNIFKFNLPEKEATPGYEIVKSTGNVIDTTAELIFNTPENRIPLYVLSGGYDITVKKTNSNSSVVWNFSGHSHYVYAVAVDSAGNVYSGSYDQTVKKIDSSGNLVWTFSGHTDTVYAVAVDADGNVYSGSRDQTVKKIDSSGNLVWTFSGHTGDVFAVAVDADGNVYSGSDDGTVKKIDSNGVEVWTFSGHTGWVYAVAVDADGNVYSGSSNDHTVKKIDSSGVEVWSFSGHTSTVSTVAVDADGNVYSGSDDHTVKKIDSSGNLVWTFSGHTGDVLAVAVDADGNVYSGSDDDTLKKIDSSGSEVWTFSGHTSDVLAVAVLDQRV